MEIRTRIQEATKDAMRSRDQLRLSTLRLIGAALKDREIAVRGEPGQTGLDEADVVALLSKMVKQRQESARAYEEGGRLELAERETQEIAVIQEFLPRQLDQAEVAAAIDAVIADLGATGVRDMGRVMASLRERHAGQMDFAAAGAVVKSRLMG
ncbi:GatB/YqeY domain-containing protein [Paracoccus panacisoli]|uniref:Glutamyl-tRNA amidotransferase n=2 Tax=Paracoccus TaxID=265 RepID=A0A099GK79_9RHOB|nr:GatB/YqeY domain-containing protein [Paracoccus sanguinis]KGJ15626.1 glutamyl-tRNA amidotransferase [Paracoccus sanguinis]KGJ16911.1 glutamyl-tRNA amidotransferase [Paracoccus sanguinis]KGJ22937.1 glutamyl-tRNA amidotransferase [Paracoccus sanguinis]QJD17978.1 GatB/YqeY domain-containing protein [Paracoccus sanguinis]